MEGPQLWEARLHWLRGPLLQASGLAELKPMSSRKPGPTSQCTANALSRGQGPVAPQLRASVSPSTVWTFVSVLGDGLGGLGSLRQMAGGMGVRTTCCQGQAGLCMLKAPTLRGHRGRGTDVLPWQQMAGAWVQEVSSSKVMSSKSRSPGNLACGHCG